ncbi:alpha/beta-hydrolase [Artomyces pyxidatus]|uniref:Alpha/beta-hydrolase n=1 Tax=Artomyces pyxidatus TaxID=48021 RepID=A0ACB8TBK4_9AGAM|nr:alpha/beta-hydrolase [Artomyces pyxidatus]
MTVSTTSAAVYITPVVLKTLIKHFKRKEQRLRDGKHGDEVATDDVFFDEAYHIVKAFIELGTKNTIESLQAFTNTHVPAPFWAAVAPVRVPLSSCNRAADLLIDWFGPEDLAKVVGGERWWQVRGLDGIDSEWITERKYLNGDSLGEDKKGGSYDETIKKMDKLESVMLYVHGGGYFWGSINTHRYQIIRYARKFKGRSFAVNYRKAPQYPWPCPLHDVIAAYFYLTQPPPGASHKAIDPTKLVFAGDSAGAGLCLTALTVLRDMGLPLPAGAVLISPWVDLTHSFDSVMSNTSTDIMPPHGFVHRPSLAWPVDPLPQARSRVIPTETNPPPQPGHADTLEPSNERAEEQENLRQRAEQEGLSTAEVERQQYNDSVHSQAEMLRNSAPPESPTGGQQKPGGEARQDDAASSGSEMKSRNTVEEDLHPDIDLEQMDKWEPKPPKVLMKDPTASPLEIRAQIQQYATNEQLTHPLVSPVLQGSLGNLCPLYIIAGDGEVLRDEIIYIAHRAAHPEEFPVRKGVVREGRRQRENVQKFTIPTKVHLQVFDGMPHVLTVFSFTESAKYAYRSIAQFVRHVTIHSTDHLERNPFPELHRPECQIHVEDVSEYGFEVKEKKSKSTLRRMRPGNSKRFEDVKEEDKRGVNLYEDNQQAVAEEVKAEDTDPMPGQAPGPQKEAVNKGQEQKSDIPYVLMIRERVDITGHVRPMEAKEDVPALRVRPSEVGVIKEAPVRRWVTGQEMVDKKFARLAVKVINKRRKYEVRAEKMLQDARDTGLVLQHEAVDRENGQQHLNDRQSDDKSRKQLVRLRSVASGASSVVSTSDTGKINEDMRWGPLDLDNEHPPPTAIAGRRDTPEALALLKKSIYHSAPKTHKTVPKMKAMQTLRATLDPNDNPVKPPKQSVSEEQTRAHIIPMHGLAIWDSLLSLFMRKGDKASHAASRVVEQVVGSTTQSQNGDGEN